MDRARRRPGVLIAAALLLVGAAPASFPLKALRWLAPGTDRVAAFTRQPVECLKAPLDPVEAYRVEIGRAAFRTPLLLGGQAARAGVTCETCHTNGRRNANFAFPGVSGPPGTADVTDSLFSSHRGDDVFDPRPIPDLGGPKANLKVSQARTGQGLETFIHGLITEEFDGAPPPTEVLAGLAAYVRALDPSACRAETTTAVRAEEAVENATRAVRTAIKAFDRGDTASTAVMIEAARSQLGAIFERYPGDALSPARQGVSVADLDLASTLAASRSGDRTVADRLAGWLARTDAWVPIVRRQERRSLYDPRVLAEAIARAPRLSNDPTAR